LAAFRELCKQGSFSGLADNNPAKPITRGEFYALLVQKLYPNQSSSNLTTAEAFKTLRSAGIIGLAAAPNETTTIDELLNTPLSAREALSLVAKLIDKNVKMVTQSTQKQKIATHSGKKRLPNGWFVQPAFAADDSKSIQPLDGAKPMDYLDAAQIVLTASPALR
jgi:hypothetical protein